MKPQTFVLVLILAAFTTGTAESQLERVDPDVEVPSVTVEGLANALADKSIRVIDVRLVEDFEADPVLLRDADWRDPNDINGWVSELKKGDPVVVYCVRGRWVSQSVTKKLVDAGFDVAQLTGGIEAWKAAGQPTRPSTGR